MTAKRFILAAIGLKMTAKLTDFAVNYKISESGNLTNKDFFNLLGVSQEVGRWLFSSPQERVIITISNFAEAKIERKQAKDAA